jgi:hypothetical protein
LGVLEDVLLVSIVLKLVKVFTHGSGRRFLSQ